MLNSKIYFASFSKVSTRLKFDNNNNNNYNDNKNINDTDRNNYENNFGQSIYNSRL